MKKLLFLITALLTVIILPQCGKDDEPEASLTVMANVYFDGTPAAPFIVTLYDYDSAKDFDKSYDAMCNYGDTRELLDRTGKVIKAAYNSPSMVGVNTFQNVKAGKYIAVALYKPTGYTYPMFYYYGYSTIDVSSSNSPVMKNFKFVSSMKRGEFLPF